MCKQTDNFKIKIHYSCQLNQFLINTLNSLETDTNKAANITNQEIDTTMISIPNNTPDNIPYTTPNDPMIHITGSNTELNQTIKQKFPSINMNLHPSKAFHTILHSMPDEFDPETIVTEHKTLINGTAGITSNPYVILIVRLHGKAQIYKDILKFALSSLFHQIKLMTELKEENIENLKEKLQDNWILLGSYVNHYLKENNLPNAELLTELSSSRYEGSESEARIYFTHDSIETIAMFEPSIGAESRVLCSNNLRPIRKLIELSKRNVVHLYADPTDKTNKSHTITQLVRLRDEYSGSTAKTATGRKEPTDTYIKFSGFMHWSVVRGTKEIFSYYHGRYLLNSSSKNTGYEVSIEELQNVDQNVKHMIRNLIHILAKQKHGASVIISDFASKDGKKMVDDLCRQNYGLRLRNEIAYDPESYEHGWKDENILLSLTDIDGALFMDLSGNCIAAIGALLYSEINIKGNTGRGSRYNSMYNYIMQKRNGIYIGIVISEDGMIDVFRNQTHTQYYTRTTQQKRMLHLKKQQRK